MSEVPRILFAGGGTGGHVYPAVAIADAVRRILPDAVLEFAGTRDRMEWEAVPRAGYTIHPISISGFHRGQPLRNLTLPFKMANSLRESISLIRTFRPDVAVGTGGYVSGPVLFAASLLGIPIVIQEQNAYAGLTNRLLGKRAKRIHVAFVEAKDYLPPERCIYSGNPTRRELLLANRSEARKHYGIPEEAFVLAVFGGSLGSRAINEAVLRHAEKLLEDDQVFVIWQSGNQYFEEMRRRAHEHGRLRLLEYVERMDFAYAAADVVLSRSGAITCSELMVTGTPSILVPSPNVAEDHQTLNARSMANSGAAVLLPEAELDARLVEEFRSLRSDEKKRHEMAEAARRIARPDAAEHIARDVLNIAGFRPPETDASNRGGGASKEKSRGGDALKDEPRGRGRKEPAPDAGEEKSSRGTTGSDGRSDSPGDQTTTQ